MIIAVTSQNRKTLTEHAGRCRKFWLYQVDNGHVVERRLLELSKQQSFHESSPHEEHPLDNVDVLISADMGAGLQQRLARRGIEAVIDSESQDPDQAVQHYLQMQR